VANDDLKALIRTIPDFPKPGIQFRDITTLLADPVGLRLAVDGLLMPFLKSRVNHVAGIEARGFILGGAVARELNCGFIPIRKKGKLPHKTIGQEYALEYGVDIIEMHEDAVRPGDRVLVVDDLIATGGTAEAAVELIRRVGGEVTAAAFVIDLPDLGGAERLREDSLAYARMRMQFGRPIASFQSMKHKCADMLVEVELAKSAAYYAAAALDEGDEDLPAVASLAKACTSEAYLQTAIHAIQIHGGIGFTWDNDTHLWFKRAKSSEVLFGDAYEHRERMMRHYAAAA
jgi:adenine phosphoribosyltransferase